MKSLRKYSIPFTGLKLGRHEFDFTVTDAFFEEFEYSLVKKANLQCKVELEKQETMLILSFHLWGTVERTCDRCLATYPLPLDLHEQQIAKFSEEEIDEDEEIITLSRKEHEINVAELIYEYITVAVPFIGTCNNIGKTPYCDKEMLARLDKLSESNEEDKGTDPRWDALKNIK